MALPKVKLDSLPKPHFRGIPGISNTCAPQDIDGLIRYDMDSNHETLLTQSLGIKNLRHWDSVSYGGGAGNATIGHAAQDPPALAGV